MRRCGDRRRGGHEPAVGGPPDAGTVYRGEGDGSHSATGFDVFGALLSATITAYLTTFLIDTNGLSTTAAQNITIARSVPPAERRRRTPSDRFAHEPAPVADRGATRK